MLTDDDLARELGAAFRAGTEELAYTGRRQPRSSALIVVPVAAAGVAVAAAVAVAPWSEDAPGAGPAPALPTVAAGPVPAPAMVGDTVELAGFTLHYERPAGEPDPLRPKYDVDAPPADARPVPMPGTEAQAWVGVDPESGDNAIYLQAPTRNGGKLFAILSSTWTQDQLVDLLHNGNPN